LENKKGVNAKTPLEDAIAALIKRIETEYLGNEVASEKTYENMSMLSSQSGIKQEVR